MDKSTMEMLDKLIRLDTERGKLLDILSQRLDTASERIKRLEARIETL